MNRELQRWIQALALAVLFILIKGYTFNTDDQAEHLPQVYQMLDPELYPHDYFVQETNQIFTVRFYYERLVYAGATVMSVANWCFLLMLVFTSIMTYSIQRMYELVFGFEKLSWLAPILVLVVFNGWTVGGNGVFGNGLICSLMAKSLATLGLWRFLAKDQFGSGIAIGAATLFQPLVGFQLMLVQGLVLVSRMDLKSIAKLGSGFLVIGSPMIIPLFIRQFTLSGGESQLFWDVMYQFRNYLHYLPSMFPITHFAKSAIMLAVGVGAVLYFRSTVRKDILISLAAILLGLAVYTVGIELIGLNAIGKTQWYKTTIWIALFGAIGLTAFLQLLVPEKLKLGNRFTRILPLTVIVFGLFMATNTAKFSWPPKRIMVGEYQLTDQEKMHQWIAENTDKDAVFLVAPNNYSFQCEAKRSIPIGFKAIIHEPEFMISWYQEFQRIYGIGLDNLDGRKTEEIATASYNSVRFSDSNSGIDYRLDDASQCQFLDELGPIVHQEGNWILTEFQSE